MTTRAMMSLALPAPSGTTTVTFRAGQSCAVAAFGPARASGRKASASMALRMRVIIVSVLLIDGLSRDLPTRTAVMAQARKKPRGGVVVQRRLAYLWRADRDVRRTR